MCRLIREVDASRLHDNSLLLPEASSVCLTFQPRVSFSLLSYSPPSFFPPTTFFLTLSNDTIPISTEKNRVMGPLNLIYIFQTDNTGEVGKLNLGQNFF